MLKEDAMKKSPLQLLAFTVLSVMVIASCGTSTPDPVEEEMKIKVRVAATLTQKAVEESQRSTQEAVVESQPTMTPIPPSETPEPTALPTSSPTPTIEHVMVPGEPGEKISSHLTDVSSIHYAAEGYTYGDQYLINRFERPFTAESMEYVSYLDIILTNLKYYSPWVYFILRMEGDLPEDGDVTYGVELDLDEDGRGEYFISASLPLRGEWTTDGVKVYRDLDGDVGGPHPLFSDAPAEGLTGYEDVIFNEGQGKDPDLAWVRRDPEAANQLQIAIKESLVGTEGYLWSIWADGGPQDLTLADYNDQWTFEEAGCPYPEHSFYPIKALALVDSTCRSWFGFEPVGVEPGLCRGYPDDQNEKIMGYCPQYYTHKVNCNEVCLLECPENAPYCIPCELNN